MRYWHIQPEWRNETAIILCGGTSVTSEVINLIRRARAEGRVKVIAVNSTYLTAPWADIVFFADERWWTRELKERPSRIKDVEGRFVTVSAIAKGERLLRLRRATPTKAAGLSLKRNEVAVQRSSLHGALNLCYHLEVERILIVGADNRDGNNGRAHYHDEYPWPRRKTTWKVKQDQLAYLVQPLELAGVEVINCSPISALPWWPKVNLEKLI